LAKKSSVQVKITIPLEWKQSDIEMVAKARAWAVKAHAGQKDKAGKDYFKAHVTVVAEGVKGDPIAEAVAFLHDTVEDTSVTIEDIRTGFPKEVADAVSALTHSKGISYAEYLWHIQQNSIAAKVKLSDLRSNVNNPALTSPLVIDGACRATRKPG
jgi:(p)ppGpp synthase/HD superfamily hydrolase